MNPLDKDFDYDDVEVFPEFNLEKKIQVQPVQHPQPVQYQKPVQYQQPLQYPQPIQYQQLGHQQPVQQQQHVHQQPVQQQQQRQVLEENFNPPDKREEILEKSENDGFMSEFAQDGFFDTQKLHVEEKQRIKKDLLKKEPEENTF